MNILIVGGGCFGLSSALELSNRGYSVKVFDVAQIPAPEAASTDLNKIVRLDYGADAVYTNMGAKSLKCWRDWDPNGTFFHSTGCMFLSKTPMASQFVGVTFDYLNAHEKELQGLLDSNESLTVDLANVDVNAYKSLKTIREKMPYGYISTHSGWVHSEGAVSYLYNRLKSLPNVSFHTGPLNGLSDLLKKDDQVIGLRTVEGVEYMGTVVMATGSWTPGLLPQLNNIFKSSAQPVIHLGLNSTQSKEWEGMVWSADIEETGFYGFPPTQNVLKIANHSGGYLCNDPTTSHPTNLEFPKDAVVSFRSFLDTHFPETSPLNIVKTRLCWYTESWDSDFYITRVPHLPGLILATGGTGHAFKFMPVLGSIVADVIENVETDETRRFKWRVPTDSVKKEGTRKGGLPIRIHDTVPINQNDLSGH